MSEGRDIIVLVLADAAREHGFKAVRTTNYYCEHQETICLINLQRSAWGPQFYVNAAIWFTRFGPERRPKENKCHVRWRVDSLMQDHEAKLFSQALDLEHLLPDAQRTSRIMSGGNVFGFKLLDKCKTERSALQTADDAGPHVMVQLKAREPKGNLA